MIGSICLLVEATTTKSPGSAVLSVGRRKIVSSSNNEKQRANHRPICKGTVVVNHKWPLKLKPIDGKSTIDLLATYKTYAEYGKSPSSGNWSMKVVYKDGVYISSISHVKHLHNKQWEPIEEL